MNDDSPSYSLCLMCVCVGACALGPNVRPARTATAFSLRWGYTVGILAAVAYRRLRR